MSLSDGSLRPVLAVLLVATGCARCGAVPAGVDASHDAGSTDAGDANVTDGAVDAECVPGALGCFGFSSAVPRICTAEGRWSPGTPCAQYCDRGSCVRCLPGASPCTLWDGGGPADTCTNDYELTSAGCPGGACTCGDIPAPCWQTSAECGLVGDGLGGIADCDAELGGCPDGFACGTGSSANVCVATSAGATKECMPGQYECGGPIERRCGRTGKWLVLLPGEPCGAPEICTSHGYDCGLTDDPNFGMVDCGPCPTGYTCGRWSANRCAPMP